MGNKIKRFLLCLLAVSTMTVSGNIYADDEEQEDSGAAEEVSDDTAEGAEEVTDGESGDTSTTRAKRKEAEEKVELSAADAEEYLQKIGSVDGYDIYYKDKDIDDIIWEKNGGKPKKKSEYTDAQKKLDDKIDEIKKLGELVAVDPKKGEAVASFKSGNKSGDEKIYVSDAKRYVLTTDKDAAKPIKLREVVSTLDDAYAFLSDNGKTLDIMSDDYKKITATYKYSKDDGDLAVYTGNGDSVAWLSKDKKHVYGAYREAAENDSFIMLVDDRTGIFGIENKSTGYIWWSSPFGVTQDKIATPLLIEELQSTNVLRYGVPEKRSNNNVLRSVGNDCEMTVKDISNGIRIEYNYKTAGFRYPMEYTLEGDHLKASLKVSEIEESNAANVATEMTVLGSFGAASDEEEGYFVIPDGSGALVRFNNNRTMQSNAYNQRVYGSDVTVVPNTKGAVTEQIYLPVYGIVKEDNAMLVVASKGDSNAFLSTKVSKQSNSSYNLCNFTFILRGTDSYSMSGSNEELTIFESGDIKCDDIELLYYPIAKEGADYVDIAECYRNYLTSECGVTKRTSADSSAMYVDLYGGTQKKKPVLGIPVTMKQSITTFDEAQTILSRLNENGVDSMVVSYNNWTNDGIKNKVDTGAKASGTLGGNSDFKKLRNYMDSNNIEFYPTSDNRDFYSGNGYYSFSNTSVRVSGSYSRIISYDRAYGIPDGFKKNMSLLSPDSFGKVFSDVSKSYSKAGLSGVSVGNLTTSLYGDYGKKNISRYTAMNLLTDSYRTIDDSLGNGILADSANAYALPYVSHITNVPLSSSRFDMFDEDIPFYQIVMHGLIPYSTTALNGDADSETLFLMAAATGSNPYYDMIYEETSTLKDTEYDVFYYANYENWIETASAEYKLIQPILSNVSDSTITAYDVENNGQLITTTYSNGTVVKVDLDEKTIDFNGQLTKLSKYTEEGGIRF